VFASDELPIKFLVEVSFAWSYAPDWFQDALQEAQVAGDANARRREIVFAVYLVESYLFEWVRSTVLQGDRIAITRYFPPGVYRSVTDKWKEVLKALFEDGRIANVPMFDHPYWHDFTKLVEYRNGLVHARASRPDSVPGTRSTSSLPGAREPLVAGGALHHVPQRFELYRLSGPVVVRECLNESTEGGPGPRELWARDSPSGYRGGSALSQEMRGFGTPRCAVEAPART